VIWDIPLHQERDMRTWLSDKETGFSEQLIRIISQSTGNMTPGPAEVARYGKIISYSDFESIATICKLIKACAPYTDYAMWLDARGLHSKLRSKTICEWLEKTWREAYTLTDILIISDIPNKDDPDMIARADRREVEIIVDARQKRGKCLTIVIGPNHELDAIAKYVALNNAMKEIDGNQS
jgi:hypothetical protein